MVPTMPMNHSQKTSLSAWVISAERSSGRKAAAAEEEQREQQRRHEDRRRRSAGSSTACPSRPSARRMRRTMVARNGSASTALRSAPATPKRIHRLWSMKNAAISSAEAVGRQRREELRDTGEAGAVEKDHDGAATRRRCAAASAPRLARYRRISGPHRRFGEVLTKLPKLARRRRSRARQPVSCQRSAPVAQGIEHGSPKAGVACSNHAGGTHCIRSSSALSVISLYGPVPTRGRCLVGEPMTRSGVHWSPMAFLAAASRRTATSSRSVGKSPA